jgi:hypothetical protein
MYYAGVPMENTDTVIITAKVPKGDWESLKTRADSLGMKFGPFIARILSREAADPRKDAVPVDVSSLDKEG